MSRSFVVLCGETCRGTSVPYSIAAGGKTFSPEGQTEKDPVGFGLLKSSNGTPLPYGFAIIGHRENGVLVSESGMPGMQPVDSGRIFAEIDGRITTGFAFANPGAESVTVSFYFSDQNGGREAAKEFVIPAKSKVARFIDQAPFNKGGVFAGTMTFTATGPIGVISIRGLFNERDNFIYAIQTVSPLIAGGSSSGPVVMPHFADGANWRTQVLLVNPSDQTIRGKVQFIGEGSATTAGAPVSLVVNGQSGTSFDYAIPGRASVKFDSSGAGAAVQIGSVRVAPDAGSVALSGFTLFSYRRDGVTVSQASVAAQPVSSMFRVYVESIQQSDTGSPIRSGVAITNTSSLPASIRLELAPLSGAGPTYSQAIAVPANGHIAKFIDELMTGISVPPRAILTVRSDFGQIAVTGLRLRVNENGDLLTTTMPAINEQASANAGELVFPHVVDRGGYTTQFILFNTTPLNVTVGTVEFYDENGRLLNVTYR